MTVWIIFLYILLGTFAGAFICIIPSLHIYNVAGIAVVLWMRARYLIPYYALGPFFMSLVVSFSFVNIIPMTFFNSLDESAGASILPSSAMFSQGRGKDAVLITGVGTLAGVFLLVLLYPFYFYVWPYIAAALGPHLHWIIGLIIVHYIMSEWPKGAGRGPNPLKKFMEAWRNCFAGITTFTLAGLFGLIYLSKPILHSQNSFQSIMPVFIGFFAIPSLIQNLVSKHEVPEQYSSEYINAGPWDFVYGLLPGFFGGMLAAYIPGVTAGIGSMLAGHTTNHRNLQRTEYMPPAEKGTKVFLHTPQMYYLQERLFLIAGGTIRVIYYAGAFLLLFVLTELTPYGTGRGGLTFMLRPVFVAESGDYWIISATILLSGCIAFLLLSFLTDIVIRLLPRINIKKLTISSLILISILIYITGGGFTGILIAMITTCIGMIPVFYNCRRSHCMAVLLVPIAVNM
ncbi:tripartite tricarboxylate transporter permease, partial [Elusimicrobiota bacterium]